MKILFMEWDSFGNAYVKTAFKNMGHRVISFPFPGTKEGTGHNVQLAEKIVEFCLKGKPDVIFSFNFFPVIASSAQACRIRYCSWIYDSPAILTYSLTAFFPGSYLFHFDSSEVGRLRGLGVEHVYYMPLAACQENRRIRPTQQDKEKYNADIAMIGSLYREEKFQIFRRYEKYDAYTRGYLDGLIAVQKGLYGAFILEDGLTDEMMDRIRRVVPVSAHEDNMATERWIYANYYLALQVTMRERESMLRTLSEQLPTVVYTPGDTSDIPKLKNRGSVEYYQEAPLAIKCAAINLNITLKSIHSGIPLRIWDIMSCGGFVLTNYQEDLFRHFVPGEDFVYYESEADAVDKAAYYLTHEEERKQIAANAFRKVRKEHSYEERLKAMLAIMNES